MNRSVVDRVVAGIGLVLAAVLLVATGLLFYAHSYVHGQVRDQLVEQKITFPEAGSESITSLPKADQSEVSQYAGQDLTTGAQAEVFADHYIKVHLGKIADGQTYSEVSTKAQASPDDETLAAQVNTLFKGETLRGLLLNAYAFDTMATIAFIAAWVSLAGALVLVVLSVLGFLHSRRVIAPAAPEASVATA
ncbi:hypothetical protein GCM10022223_63480 [Kineosporia mesophila]|uniref:Aromatic ring-opening dioxygenase LigA n=1 Tax=Kineosporia mesophila TaxID=566012 RepID=A0ABP7ANA7_9ACTN|nr:hypothetical protein [Kineosporia mesophila]MCD5349393.1 hypothetical protein [Kineosporia mesophila]